MYCADTSSTAKGFLFYRTLTSAFIALLVEAPVRERRRDTNHSLIMQTDNEHTVDIPADDL